MAGQPKCPDCGKQMDAGFVPDVTHGGWGRANWHPGDAEERTFLGIPAGVKVQSEGMIPVTAWRCPACGLLRFHALPE